MVTYKRSCCKFQQAKIDHLHQRCVACWALKESDCKGGARNSDSKTPCAETTGCCEKLGLYLSAWNNWMIRLESRDIVMYMSVLLHLVEWMYISCEKTVSDLCIVQSCSRVLRRPLLLPKQCIGCTSLSGLQHSCFLLMCITHQGCRGAAVAGPPRGSSTGRGAGEDCKGLRLETAGSRPAQQAAGTAATFPP